MLLRVLMKPIVGVTSSYNQNDKRYQVPESYIEAVERAGGIPVVLPPTFDAKVDALLKLVDGLILTGGVDIDPQLYGESPLPKQGNIDPLRDSFELALTRRCLKVGKPVLAICRGIQLLNVAAGGSLYQDVNSQVVGSLKHRQQAPTYYATHRVQLGEGSRLLDVFGGEVVAVNSFHHQAVKDVAPGFRATGWAEDGLVEVIESQGRGWVLGVQWHPERMLDHGMLPLFETFVRALER
jgi:putative glutamine amidotransferase